MSAPTADELARAVAGAVVKIIPPAGSLTDPRYAAVDAPSARFLDLLKRYEAGATDLLGDVQKAGNGVVLAWKRAIAASGRGAA